MVEDLIVAKRSSEILVDDQMQVRNLFVDRFCFKPLTIQEANSQEQFTQVRLRNQPIHQPTEVAHNCLVESTNACLVKLRTIENSYAKSRTITWQSRQTNAW